MPNRVIKDSIWSSPTLAKLPIDAQLHWPRLLLMADDWGCFNADPDVVLGLVYPKMKGMTTRKIDDLFAQYGDAGLMFLWFDVDRRWGYFPSWGGHQYCNSTNLDDGGKQQRHRRRTPEPPENELSAYLKSHSQINQVVSGKLEQVRTLCNNSIIPNPNPNPNPNPKVPLSDSSPKSDHPSPTIAQDVNTTKLLAHLNDLTGAHYRPVPANLDLLAARLASATVEEVTAVIDAKVAEWQHDPAMQKFLRPSTLFRSSNFEQYLGQLGIKPAAPPEEVGEFDHLPRINNWDYWICGCPKTDLNGCTHRHHGLTLEESWAYDEAHP